MNSSLERTVKGVLTCHPRIQQESLPSLPRPLSINEVRILRITDWQPERELEADYAQAGTPARALSSAIGRLVDFFADYRGNFVDCPPYLRDFFEISPDSVVVALFRSDIVGTTTI